MMEFEIKEVNNTRIAEVIAEERVISNAADGTDLIGNLYYQDVDRVILHQENIIPEFFDLKTGIAGEVLQKFSNYRMRLAIVGDFSIYPGKSIQDFIFESNKYRQVNFVASTAEAIDRLSS